jgi:hypothetical protein
MWVQVPPLSPKFHIGDVAQSVEQMAVNHLVGGSSPSIPAKIGAWRSGQTHRTLTPTLMGSNPIAPAMTL